MDSQKIQSYQDKMEKIFQGQKKRMLHLSYADAARKTKPSPVATTNTKKRKSSDDQSLIAPEAFKGQSYAFKGKQPNVFDGTSDEKVFVRKVEAYCRAIGNVSPYKKILIQLSYMRGPKVKNWVSKIYKEASLRVSLDINTRNDPALWVWFRQVFSLKYGDTVEKGKALKTLLKLRMTKGDVETYIKRFEVLRRSVGWPEDSQGTVVLFQRGLGPTNTREIQTGTIPRPTTLAEWYAAARNQWKGKETCQLRTEINLAIDNAILQTNTALAKIDAITKLHPIHRFADEIETNIARAAGIDIDSERLDPIIARATGINTISFAPSPVVVRAAENPRIKPRNDGLDIARWREAPTKQKGTTQQRGREIVSEEERETKKPRTDTEPRFATIHTDENNETGTRNNDPNTVRRQQTLKGRKSAEKQKRRDPDAVNKGEGTNKKKEKANELHTDLPQQPIDNVAKRCTTTQSQQAETQNDNLDMRNSNAVNGSASVSRKKERTNQSRTKDSQNLAATESEPCPVTADANKTETAPIRIAAPNRITWTRGLSVNGVHTNHENSLRTAVKSECSQGMPIATALTDSNATGNFDDLRTAERWEILRKKFPNSRSIVSINGSTNKVDMVAEACVFEVLYQGHQQLQQLYITNLGIDRTLLERPWLQAFNPQIHRDEGTTGGEVTLKTAENTREGWRKLQKTALIARVQKDLIAADRAIMRRDTGIAYEPKLTITKEPTRKTAYNADWEAIKTRTNFAQNWAREANATKQEQIRAVVLPEETEGRPPPARPENYTVQLKTDDEIKRKVHPLTKQKLKTTRKLLNSDLVLRHTEICNDNESPWSTTWDSTGEESEGSQLLQDGRVDNSWTAREVYPMSRTELIVGGQKEGKLLTALDIRWESHEVQFHKEDQWEAVFRTPNDLFKLKEKSPDSISAFTDDMLIVIGKTRVLLRRMIHKDPNLRMSDDDDRYNACSGAQQRHLARDIVGSDSELSDAPDVKDKNPPPRSRPISAPPEAGKESTNDSANEHRQLRAILQKRRRQQRRERRKNNGQMICVGEALRKRGVKVKKEPTEKDSLNPPPEEAKKLRLDMEIGTILKSDKTRPKKRKKKDGLDQSADTEVSQLRKETLNAADLNEQANREKLPATLKLKLLPKVMGTLKKSSPWQSIVDNKLLEGIRRWLEPLPDKSLPVLDIQKEFLDILLMLDITRTTDGLMSTWSRPTIKKSASYQDRAIPTMDVSTADSASGATRERLNVILARTREDHKKPLFFLKKERILHSLMPTERDYDTYDQKLLAIIHELRIRQHICLSSQRMATTYTDHKKVTSCRHAQRLANEMTQCPKEPTDCGFTWIHELGILNYAEYLLRCPGYDTDTNDNEKNTMCMRHKEDMGTRMKKKRDGSIKTGLLLQGTYALPIRATIMGKFWRPDTRKFTIAYGRECAITSKRQNPFYIASAELTTNLPVSQRNDILTTMNHECSKAAVFPTWTKTPNASGATSPYEEQIIPFYEIPKRVTSGRKKQDITVLKPARRKERMKQNIPRAVQRDAPRLLVRRNDWQKKEQHYRESSKEDQVWLERTNLCLDHPTERHALEQRIPFIIADNSSSLVAMHHLELSRHLTIQEPIYAPLFAPHHKIEERGTNSTQPKLVRGGKEHKTVPIAPAFESAIHKEHIEWLIMKGNEDDWNNFCSGLIAQRKDLTDKSGAGVDTPTNSSASLSTSKDPVVWTPKQEDINYHTHHLSPNFAIAQHAVRVHDNAVWHYPLTSWLRRRRDNNLGRATTGIVVRKFKFLKKGGRTQTTTLRLISQAFWLRIRALFLSRRMRRQHRMGRKMALIPDDTQEKETSVQDDKSRQACDGTPA
jgi:transcription factor SPN1